MKQVLKVFAYSICILFACIVVLQVAFWRVEVAIKALTGKGIAVESVGTLKAAVSGRAVECPLFVIDRMAISPDVASQHAFDFRIGTNPVSVAVLVQEHGYLYWLGRGKIGKTCVSSSVGPDGWFLFNRWLLLSEVALNCTYDVLDDMKGLRDSSVEYSEDENAFKYKFKYMERETWREIAMEIDKRWLAKPVPGCRGGLTAHTAL